MRDQALLTRRSLASALPFAALTAAPAAALSALASSADAELVDLGRQWLALHVQHVAHWHAWQAMSDAEQDLRNKALDAECEAMSFQEWALEARIHAIPAATIAGLAVKARIVAHEFDIENLDVASIEHALPLTGDCQANAAVALALDVLKLAGSLA